MAYIEYFRQAVLNELKKKNWSRKDLARQININTTLLNSMLRGQRRFNEDQVQAIADAFNMEPYQLFSKENMVSQDQVHEMIKKAVEFKDNYQMVEEIEPISCGNLSNIMTDSIVGYKVFEKSYLKGMFKPFLTRASGDSMYPTLMQGDLILFNRDPDKLQDPDPNKIFLVNLTPEEEEPNLTIKRITIDKENWTLTIFPDNRLYSVETYDMSRKKSLLDYILGVATWLGKEL